jgi:multiple sugar transport system ATP-binding protein
MNLFEVPVDHGRELVLDSSERMSAPEWAVDQLAGLSRIVVGIRPEDLHIDGDGGGLQASVRGVEDLGAEVIAHLEAESAVATSRHIRELADELDDPRLESGLRSAAKTITAKGNRVRIVARLAATVRVREGEQLRLTFDVDKVHLFDVESGLALKRPEGDVAADIGSSRSLMTGPSLVQSNG